MLRLAWASRAEALLLNPSGNLSTSENRLRLIHFMGSVTPKDWQRVRDEALEDRTTLRSVQERAYHYAL